MTGRLFFYEENGTIPAADEWRAIRAQDPKAASILLARVKFISDRQDTWGAAVADQDRLKKIYRFTHSRYEIWYSLKTRVTLEDVIVLGCGEVSRSQKLSVTVDERFNRLSQTP